MMTLPPGFDVAQLVSDFQGVAIPFVVVAVLFATYKFIMMAIGRVNH
jgi:hypothetical protein